MMEMFCSHHDQARLFIPYSDSPVWTPSTHLARSLPTTRSGLLDSVAFRNTILGSSGKFA